MVQVQDIHSLSEFQRNTRDFVIRMKRSKKPFVLTVNGRAEIVVQDAQSYQDILDRLERAEAVAAIRQGMDEFERGEGLDAHEAFEDLRRKHGIPR